MTSDMTLSHDSTHRNHLYKEAKRHGDYAYFIFLVDDVSVVHKDFNTGLMAHANPFRNPIVSV